MGTIVPAPSRTPARPVLVLLLACVATLLAPARGDAESCLATSRDDAVAKAPGVICPLRQVPRGRFFPVSPVETSECRKEPRPPCPLCRIVKCQLSHECGIDNSPLVGHPTADTVFTRRGVEIEAPAPLRQALIAAAVSQSPRFAIEVTKEARKFGSRGPLRREPLGCPHHREVGPRRLPPRS